MKPWLLIPAKSFDEAKSRLAGVLSAPQRAALSAHLLARTLRMANASALFARIVVVSRDPAALALAEAFAALALSETVPDLNAALRQARLTAEREGADAVLTLPADLPRLQAADLHLLAGARDEPRTVVIAPSRDQGTNALLLPLPAPFDFAFGPDSYPIHHVRAASAGCTVRVVCTETLRFDLDSPADLEELTADAPILVEALLSALSSELLH
ncbi:2-phospho-L-lactate guanylyltransferase [Caldilinea sp.]|uniref:2-phospho-L-lactate guanylyltransferase n=1 Tax=Caldilinea sp. TaxID=2293560 RepID=UPI002D16E55E|nr:2-phospho-L-lactate guanylyltransferase [Anaerolineales bacterium]HQY91188.1 2-phospho-L-lactate guanylyltransferase [Caldilinea sp.]HRA68942.1 2-phospho-L-lactate guanylyltransferase [Caldilinea sp.]